MATLETTKPIGHAIAGKIVEGDSGRIINVTSPVDGSLLGEVLAASDTVIDQAVQAASKAFASWSAVPVKERVQPLFRFKQLIEENIAELSALVTAENGKT